MTAARIGLVITLITLLFPYQNAIQADDKSKIEELAAEATARFEESRDELDAKMALAFDAAEKKISAGGGELKLSAEEKVHMLEAVEEEREAFESNRSLPTSIYLRRASQDYLVSYNVAVARLAKEFAKAISLAERKKFTDELKDLIDERDRLCDPFDVMAWRYTWAPGRTNDYIMKSDGSFGGAGFKWTLDGDKLVMRGRDLTNLKASVWTDSCYLSPDGRKMDGKNHLGHQKYGSRID